MVLNPCWMPQAYVWFCWLICDCSSHLGPQLPLKCSLSSFPRLRALNRSQPETFSVLLQCPHQYFSLSSLNLVTECTCPIIPAQNLLCWKSSHNSGPAGVDLFCFGCLFYTTEQYWAQGTGNPELLSFSLKFSVFICQVWIKAPAWSASKFNGPGKAGVR